MGPEPLILWALACHRQVPPDATVRRAPTSEQRDPHHAARARYLHALYLSSQGRYDQAEASLRVAMLFDPGSPALHVNYGRWLVDLGAWTWAETHLLAARDAGAGAQVGEDLVRLYQATGRPDAAEEAALAWLEEPLELGHGERARALVDVGRAALAFDDAVRAVRDEPGVAAHRRFLIVAAAAAERWWTTLEVLAAVAEARPEDARAWADLAGAAAEAGHEPHADAGSAAWYALAPEDALLPRARSVLRREAADEARPLFDALEGNHQREAVLARAGLGGLLGESGVVGELEAALVELPGDRELSLRLAEVHVQLDQLDEALAALEAAGGLSAHALARLEAWTISEIRGPADAIAHLEGHPQSGHPSVLTMRGGLLLDAGRTAEAVELLKVASARRPEVVSLRVRLAEALLEVGDLERAAEEAQVALAAEPGRSDALLVLAGLDLDAGGGGSWIGPLYEAVERAPGDAWLVAALARAHYQGGDATEAVAWARAARVLSDDEALLTSLQAIPEDG